MADLNVCTFTGRLTKDAEKKTLPTGTELVSIDIANNTGWGDYAKTMYLNISLWGKAGVGVFPYLKKGQPVAVTGQLEVQEWTSKHDGSKQRKNVLSCNNIILLPNGKRNTDDVVTDQNVMDDEEDIVY